MIKPCVHFSSVPVTDWDESFIFCFPWALFVIKSKEAANVYSFTYMMIIFSKENLRLKTRSTASPVHSFSMCTFSQNVRHTPSSLSGLVWLLVNMCSYQALCSYIQFRQHQIPSHCAPEFFFFFFKSPTSRLEQKWLQVLILSFLVYF